MSRPWDAILSFKRARAAGERGLGRIVSLGRLHGPDGLGALRRLIRRGRRARGQRQQSHDEEHARDPAMIDGSHSRRFSSNQTTRSPGRGLNRDAHGLRRPPRARKDCVPAGSVSGRRSPATSERSSRARTRSGPSLSPGSCDLESRSMRLDLARREQGGQAVDERAHVADAVTQERRRRHHHVGADQQVLDDLVRRLDAGGGGQRRRHAPGRIADPEQRQADLGRRAELQVQRQAQRAGRCRAGRSG